MPPSCDELEWDGDTLVIFGDFDGEIAARVAEHVRSMPLPPGDTLTVEMGELDLDDGVSVAELVNAIRTLIGRGRHLVLIEAPQMLAHTLYKVSMLDTQPITLVRPREDEGSRAS
jgi:ABC-type transporter Mla MlaB component